MALQHYTEEDLLAKKYNDLLKISKASGIKPSKRLKVKLTLILSPFHSYSSICLPFLLTLFALPSFSSYSSIFFPSYLLFSSFIPFLLYLPSLLTLLSSFIPFYLYSLLLIINIMLYSSNLFIFDSLAYNVTVCLNWI